MNIILLVVIVLWLALMLFCFLSRVSDYWGALGCKYMHWHRPKESTGGFDGCSFTAICRFCGKEILQDSQGNWF